MVGPFRCGSVFGVLGLSVLCSVGCASDSEPKEWTGEVDVDDVFDSGLQEDTDAGEDSGDTSDPDPDPEEPVDADGDGVPASEDCDDADPGLGARVDDADCDGVATAEDCDDADPGLGARASDADCDGTLSAEDCDDGDPERNELDRDGDGVTSCSGDCDDADDDIRPGLDDGLLADRDCIEGIELDNLIHADAIFDGENAEDHAGFDLDGAGDVDGDGLGDVIIGAYRNQNELYASGRSYVVLGASLTSGITPTLDMADHAYVGEDFAQHSGQQVAGLGDVDGDGLDDIAIGAPWHVTEARAGKVYVLLGSSISGHDPIEGLDQSDYGFTGESDRAFAGAALASAGDVDGDGLNDILVGAVGQSGDGDGVGKAYLILAASLGAPGERSLSTADYRFSGTASDGNAGISVAAAGDVDGDGLGDFLVGDSGSATGGGSAGAVYLVRGSSLGSESDRTLGDGGDVLFLAEEGDDWLGLSVSSAGDVDGDGLDDLIVGAPSSDRAAADAGAIYVVLGASIGATDTTFDLSRADHRLTGVSARGWAGYSVAGVGDIDGDGLDDVAVGVPEFGSTARRGRVHIITGAGLATASGTDLAGAEFTLFAENDMDVAGHAVSGAGDVDGDGLDDVLVSAPGLAPSGGGDNRGRSYLLLGGR